MTPKNMATTLAAIEGLPLRAVLLYGSAASGDHAGARSDVNLLIVLDRLGRTELDALAKPVRRWVRTGNPPPMMFARDRLVRSADIFPIEIQDIKETGQLLHGDDVLAGIRVRPEHLRIEIEHELKGKLAHLQAEYLRVGAGDRALRDLMAGSLSTFLVLARASLRFFDPDVPPRKLEALRALNQHVTVDVETFEAVQAVKEGQHRPRGVELRTLFDRYLAAIEQLAVMADTKLDPDGGGALPSDPKD